MKLGHVVFSIILGFCGVNSARCDEPITFALTWNRQFPFNVFSFGLTPTNNFVVEESGDLLQWRPYFNIFARVGSFQVGDRFLAPIYPPQFYKVSSATQMPSQMSQSWLARNIRNYRYHMKRICFCPPYSTLSGDITVQDGQPILVENANAAGNPVTNVAPSEFKSVEQLFNLIESDMSKAEVAMISFDLQLSYPKYLHINYSSQADDDDVDYAISDLVVLE
jgi:hypothetical protein